MIQKLQIVHKLAEVQTQNVREEEKKFAFFRMNYEFTSAKNQNQIVRENRIEKRKRNESNLLVVTQVQ